MNREILMVAEAVSAEKGVAEDIIFEAIELALATATKKRYDEEADIQVSIDRESGDYVTKRIWLVMPDTELALLGTQFTTEEAAEVDTSLKPGDYHEETVENVDFGRIAAQTAKQVIVQRVRDAERAQIADAYSGREGELLAGTVKKVTRDNIIVDLGNNAEGLLPRGELVGRETFRINDQCGRSSPKSIPKPEVRSSFSRAFARKCWWSCSRLRCRKFLRVSSRSGQPPETRGPVQRLRSKQAISASIRWAPA